MKQTAKYIRRPLCLAAIVFMLVIGISIVLLPPDTGVSTKLDGRAAIITGRVE